VRLDGPTGIRHDAFGLLLHPPHPAGYHEAMLKYRLIFGPIMIALLGGVLYLDDRLDRVDIGGTVWQSLFMGRAYLPAGLVMLAVFLLLILAGSGELCAIVRAKGVQASRMMFALAGMTGCVSMYFIPHKLQATTAVPLFATLLIAVFLGALLQYSWARRRTQGAVTVAAATLLALLYMGVLPGFFLAIRRWHSAWVIAAIILVIKCCDIGAYFTGRLIGRHKLIPWLSPGKTWEGLAGGVAFSALAAVLMAMLLNAGGAAGMWQTQAGQRVFVESPYPLWAAAVAGGVFALLGQFGDLVASLFKRDAGIKDSGRSIPGFGGMLDVVDSPLIVAPVAYWVLVLAAE
jgi:phosphatidate cytidylyltransferase